MKSIQIILIIVGFFQFYKFRNNSKIKIWDDILLFPTIVIFIYFFSELSKTSLESYKIGKLTSKILVPYIIMCTVLYFDIKYKIKRKETLQFPILLILLLILTLLTELI
jgi:hypothetical protein